MTYILAISGPTAAGKSYFSKNLVKAINDANLDCVKISTDEFYHDLSHLTPDERTQINYDNPQSIDHEAFKKTIFSLTQQKSVDVPVYDFTTHTRTEDVRNITPADLIIVEGIFSLSFAEVNPYYNLKIFIELDQDLRLIRRVRRDIRERGRSVESVFNQYLQQVRPSQQDFVIQDRSKADIILLGNRNHQPIFHLIIAAIRSGKNELHIQ